MYAPISDDDRPSARRHSIRARKDSVGTDSIRKGVKGAVPRRRSSAAASRNSVPKVKRTRSPPIDDISRPAVSGFDRLATYIVERQISEYRDLLPLPSPVPTKSRDFLQHPSYLRTTSLCRVLNYPAFLLLCRPLPGSTVSVHHHEAVQDILPQTRDRSVWQGRR